MIRSRSQIKVNILCCGKCGAEVIRVAKNMQVVIPLIHYKCLNCDSVGFFDKIFGDTIDKKFNETKIRLFQGGS